jgi:hypothetical protein
MLKGFDGEGTGGGHPVIRKLTRPDWLLSLKSGCPTVHPTDEPKMAQDCLAPRDWIDVPIQHAKDLKRVGTEDCADLVCNCRRWNVGEHLNDVMIEFRFGDAIETSTKGVEHIKPTAPEVVRVLALKGVDIQARKSPQQQGIPHPKAGSKFAVTDQSADLLSIFRRHKFQ